MASVYVPVATVYSLRPGAPYGDQRIEINHKQSSKKD